MSMHMQRLATISQAIAARSTTCTFSSNILCTKSLNITHVVRRKEAHSIRKGDDDALRRSPSLQHVDGYVNIECDRAMEHNESCRVFFHIHPELVKRNLDLNLVAVRLGAREQILALDERLDRVQNKRLFEQGSFPQQGLHTCARFAEEDHERRRQ